jgi:hypothetical protein
MKSAVAALFAQTSAVTGVIEKYYGVVRPITTEKYGTFPIACTATKECSTPDHLYAAVPNDRYTGIAYVEIGNTTMRLNPRFQSVVEYTIQARYVAWYNAAKLGFAPCDGQEKIMLQAMRCTTETKQIEIAPGIRAEVESTLTQTSGDYSDIFRPYRYADRAHLLVWPYEAFALNFTLKLHVPAVCLNYDLPNPVTCITV